MNIKAGNFVVVKLPNPFGEDFYAPSHFAIKESGKSMYKRDFISEEQIGTALIEVERLRRFDVKHTPPRDLETIVDVVTKSVPTILDSIRDDENKLEFLIDAGVLIANAIEHIVKNAK